MGEGNCRKCGCTSFTWNPVSAARKLRCEYNHDHNDSCYVTEALRNCTCGHHYNYHGWANQKTINGRIGEKKQNKRLRTNGYGHFYLRSNKIIKNCFFFWWYNNFWLKFTSSNSLFFFDWSTYLVKKYKTLNLLSKKWRTN